MKKQIEKVDDSMAPIIFEDVASFAYVDSTASVKNARRKSKTGKIVFDMSYDRKNYYGIDLPRKDKNPKATPFWFIHAKDANVKKWLFLSDKFLKGRGL